MLGIRAASKSSDGQLIQELIARIYEASVRPDAWAEVIEGIADLLSAKDVSVEAYNSSTAENDIICRPIDPEFAESYSSYWSTNNFLRQESDSLPVGRVFSFDTFISKQSRETSAFFQEWWRPQGMDVALGANLLRDGSLSVAFTVFRPETREAFNDDDVARFSALVPHLARATEIRRKFALSDQAALDLRTALAASNRPTLIMTDQLVVVFANSAAEYLFAGRGLRLTRSGQLTTDHPPSTAKLHELASAVYADGSSTRGGKFALSRDFGRPITLSITPLHPSVSPFCDRAMLVMIDDPQVPQEVSHRSDLLKTHYGLTSAESRIALAVGSGTALRAVAHDFGIGYATVRVHLARIFSKVSVTSQSELAILLMRYGLV